MRRNFAQDTTLWFVISRTSQDRAKLVSKLTLRGHQVRGKSFISESRSPVIPEIHHRVRLSSLNLPYF